MEDRLVLLPIVDDDGNEESNEWRPLEPLRVGASFHSETMHRVSICSSCSSPKRDAMSSVKKTSAILKKTLTDRHAKMATGWVVFQNQTTLSAVSWWGGWTKVTRQVEEFETSRQMERELCRDGCIGVNLERQDEYWVQELQRRRQQTIIIFQDDRQGGSRRHCSRVFVRFCLWVLIIFVCVGATISILRFYCDPVVDSCFSCDPAVTVFYPILVFVNPEPSWLLKANPAFWN